MDASFSDAIVRGALKPLTARSNLKGLLHLAGHLGALGTTGALVALSEPGFWRLPAWVTHGIVLVFLFAPLHETIHRTAFRARWLNDAVAWMCGAVLVLPPVYFRAFHFAHHRFTQDPARDPELAVPKPANLAAYLIHASGLPYWRAQIPALLRRAAGRVEQPFIAAGQRRTVITEARVLLGFYLAVAAGSLTLESGAALIYWIVPLVLAQPALRLYLLAEHMGCPLAPDMFRNTRTTRTTRLLRALAWNMPYHVEHHAYPGIPFHALPGAHEMLKGRCAAPAPGYLAVHRQLIVGLMRPAPRAGQARGP